jgi:hypothetical protein
LRLEPGFDGGSRGQGKKKKRSGMFHTPP